MFMKKHFLLQLLVSNKYCLCHVQCDFCHQLSVCCHLINECLDTKTEPINRNRNNFLKTLDIILHFQCHSNKMSYLLF